MDDYADHPLLNDEQFGMPLKLSINRFLHSTGVSMGKNTISVSKGLRGQLRENAVPLDQWGPFDEEREGTKQGPGVKKSSVAKSLASRDLTMDGVETLGQAVLRYYGEEKP